MKIAKEKDEEVVEEMKNAGVKVLRGNEWQVEGNLVLKEERIYILKNEELRVEIIWLYYNIPAPEYGGRQKTMELVMRKYWCLGVTKDIEKYVNRYNICQRMKNQIKTLVGNLMANKVLEKLWTYCRVDFITKLLLVKVSEEFREKLAKIEVSFSEGETLKEE